MGAVNFGTLTKNSKLAMVNEEETEQEDFFYSYDLEEIQDELKKQNFYYFNLSVKFGYYNGFYLRLTEENTKWIYDNSEEKTEVLKELTTIKKILIKFVKNGLLKGAYPGWVTGYPNEAETIKEIKAIIKNLKEIIKTSHTQATAKRQNKSLFDIIGTSEIND